MSIKRLLASAALGAGLLLVVGAVPSTASAAPSTSATLPQVASTVAAADWLAGQFTPSGYIPTSPGSGVADLSTTANAVLALASAGVDTAVATSGLNELAANVDSYVNDEGSDGAGQLSLLILDAHALGADPESFGGSDLVTRLLATQQTSGADAGLFGAQDPSFDGAFRQGLSLSALAAAGVTGTAQVTSAESWLDTQQCPDGGWTSYITADNPCDGDPANFAGPDTNSTSQAIQGLSAQGALTATSARKALLFIHTAQDSDGGWGFEPNAADSPGFTDPDSTALVIQAVVALGKSPSGAALEQGGSNPVSALLSFQLGSGSGSGAGAFFFPGSSDPNTLATYQALPALAGVTFPFNLAVTTTTLGGAMVGQAYSASLAATGGTAPYTWKLIPGTGTLPAGLKLHKATGIISGKPKVSGPFSIAVEVLSTKSAATPHTQAISARVLSLDVAPAA
jgi:hypothetical protein